MQKNMTDIHEHLQELLKKYQCKTFSKQINKLVRHSVHISTSRVNIDDLPIASSKFGGYPDLPDDVAWPEWKGMPLSFLGQINLADVTEQTFSTELGDTGLLLFFYATAARTWGIHAEDVGSWRVIYCSNPSICSRRKPGVTTANFITFPTCSLAFQEIVQLPSCCSLEIDRLPMKPDAFDRYGDMLRNEFPLRRDRGMFVQSAFAQASSYGDSVEHRLLGYPSEIQGEMQTHCLSSEDTIFHGTSKSDFFKEQEAMNAKASEWRLLMQFDTDDRAKMMWCDSGRMYFWIHKDDLSKKTFDKVWMVLQCY